MHEPGGSTAIDDFNPDNRAWRRFTTTTVEHLDVIGWTREDGRPVMVTLADLASGDTVTLAVMDSVEDRDPYALLAATSDGALAAHGPFHGGQTASGHAPVLAAADPTIFATCAVAVHPADQSALPDDAWLPLPVDLAAAAHPAPADTAAAVVVVVLLLDRTRAVAAAIGPFRSRAAADAWRPVPDVGTAVERLIVALHPAPPEPAIEE